MAFTIIWDSNPATWSNPNTYGTFAEIETAARTAVNGSATLQPKCIDNATGICRVYMRNSSGLPIVDVLNPVDWQMDANNRIEFVAQISNGYPCVITEDAPSLLNILRFGSTYLKVYGEVEDALIIRASPNNTTDHNIAYFNRDNSQLGPHVIIDGGGSLVAAGLNGSAGVTGLAYGVKFINVDHPYDGVFRNGSFTVDHCTIADCATYRPSASIVMTNTLVVNTPHYTGSVLGAGSGYNATTYSQASSLDLGTNSIYNVSTANDIIVDSVGGYDLRINSVLIGADSTGGNIGANATYEVVVVPPANNAPVASTNGVKTVSYNAASSQIDVTSLVTDDNNTIDWTTLTIVTQPLNGVATIGSQGVINLDYSGSNYSGSNFLEFTVKDVEGLTSNYGRVNITVSNQVIVSKPLVISPISVTLPNNSTNYSLNITSYVTAGSSAINWSSLSIVNQPLNGVATIGSQGVVTLSYNSTYSGSDIFTISLSDTQGNAVQRIVNVTVSQPNSTPTPVPQTATRKKKLPKGSVIGGGLYRNTVATLAMVDYTPLSNIRITLVVDGVRYDCPIISNEVDEISFTVPEIGASATGNVEIVVSTFAIPLVTTPIPDSGTTPVNNPPVLVSKTLTILQGDTATITLGNSLDSDGDVLTYSISGSANATLAPTGNQVIYTGNTAGVEVITVNVSDGVNNPVTGTLTITVAADLFSNYVQTRSIINPDFGGSAPLKGESRIDPVTGAKLTRLTDASELPVTPDALIVYSRYSPENSSGEYVLAFGANSTSCWLIDRVNSSMVRKILHNGTTEIGEIHELRWDASGNHPYRLYYVTGMGLYMIDDVRTPATTLIKDFSSLVPSATKVYNDVEGDCSNDGDHWAFMASHYNGVTYVVDAFVHYQVSTDTTNLLTTAAFAGTPLQHYTASPTFPRPNMVEISPLGTGVILHYGRAWGDASYGNRYEDIGTYFDGAHLWPLDFDFNTKPPVKVSVGETHSGWAFADDGREMFISQNNRTDKLDAIYVDGVGAGYNNRVEVADHSDFGWSNGFHYGKMPVSRKGWLFMNTYSNVSNGTHTTDWAADQLVMIQIKPETQNPIVWRITPNYNNYAGNYRDECPAAMNLSGNRIYLSNNWGGMLTHREVFVIELPDDWDTYLNSL